MILSLVVLHIVRSIRLVSQAWLIDETDSRFPVAEKLLVRHLTMEIILASCEVPEEISPIHPVHLIIEEKSEVISKRRHYKPILPSIVCLVRHPLRIFDILHIKVDMTSWLRVHVAIAGIRYEVMAIVILRTYVTSIITHIRMVDRLSGVNTHRTPHSREEHLTLREVFRHFRSICFHILIHLLPGSGSLHRWSPICLLFQFIWRIECLSVKQRIASILLSGKVTDKSIWIVRLIFVGRGLYT